MTEILFQSSDDAGEHITELAHAPKARAFDQKVIDRFWRQVLKGDPSDCWPWVGNQLGTGYGRIWINGKLLMAHRVSHLLHNGPIPEGHVIRHKCDNPGCCNPSHLHTGTQAQNNADKVAKGRAPRGSNHFRAKVTEEIIHLIRNDPRPNTVIAPEYTVDVSIICKIKNRKIWKHVT